MKITAIKQQVRQENRYSIYVDGKYIASLSEGELLKASLHSGQELDETALRELKNRATTDKAYMRSLDLISRRPRSEWEIQDYLTRKGFGEEARAVVTKRLKQAGLLDDKNFADQWVSARRALKLSSKRKLASELRQKRVSDEVIAEVLADEEKDDQHVLRELIERKRRQTKYRDDLKLMQYLVRNGFNYEDVKSALAKDKS